jgi:hypothetical protein
MPFFDTGKNTADADADAIAADATADATADLSRGWVNRSCLRHLGDVIGSKNQTAISAPFPGAFGTTKLQRRRLKSGLG